ncbi:hypothetical protein LB506_008133 [Fusarium annulatum]|nr:hypothetical protein LB506_008133 [Fusarium annulatum]
MPHDDHGAGSQTDMSSQSMDVFAELQGKLRAFELGLPSFLSWHGRINRDTIPPHEATILAIQRNVLQSRTDAFLRDYLPNGIRFTYLQVMLYRPILSQLLALNTSQDASDDLHSSFKHDGARACVRSSIQLINLVHETFRTETAEAWWWNSLCRRCLHGQPGSYDMSSLSLLMGYTGSGDRD